MLKAGTPAPIFVAESTQGTIRLKENFGKCNTILFFYPQNNTPVCIQQLGEAQVAAEEFRRLDTVILAVNQDSLESHCKFAEEQGYSFPLITDPARNISGLYKLGAMKEDPDLVEHAVFVIDPDGVVRYAVQGNPSIRELMERLEPV